MTKDDNQRQTNTCSSTKAENISVICSFLNCEQNKYFLFTRGWKKHALSLGSSEIQFTEWEVASAPVVCVSIWIYNFLRRKRNNCWRTTKNHLQHRTYIITWTKSLKKITQLTRKAKKKKANQSKCVLILLYKITIFIIKNSEKRNSSLLLSDDISRNIIFVFRITFNNV